MMYDFDGDYGKKYTKERFLDDIRFFINEVEDFYHIERGIYKIFTEEQILKGIIMLIDNNKFDNIYFDTTDREKVRGYLDPNYSPI